MGDGVEEVMVARVQAGVHYATDDTQQHGGTSVLDFHIEGTATGLGVLDLAGVSSGDGSGRSIVASGKVLRPTGVLSGRHGNHLGNSSKEKNLDKSKGRNSGKGRESHAVFQNGRKRNVSLEIEGSGEGDSEVLNHHSKYPQCRCFCRGASMVLYSIMWDQLQEVF